MDIMAYMTLISTPLIFLGTIITVFTGTVMASTRVNPSPYTAAPLGVVILVVLLGPGLVGLGMYLQSMRDNGAAIPPESHPEPETALEPAPEVAPTNTNWEIIGLIMLAVVVVIIIGTAINAVRQYNRRTAPPSTIEITKR